MAFWGLHFLECGEVTEWFTSPAVAEAAMAEALRDEPSWVGQVEVVGVDFNPRVEGCAALVTGGERKRC